MDNKHETPKHPNLDLPWLVADNFSVRNRMCHAMGKLSSTLARFLLGRRAEVARIGMNRRVMEGFGTNSPLPPGVGVRDKGTVMCGTIRPAKPGPKTAGLASSRTWDRILGHGRESLQQSQRVSQAFCLSFCSASCGALQKEPFGTAQASSFCCVMNTSHNGVSW